MTTGTKNPQQTVALGVLGVILLVTGGRAVLSMAGGTPPPTPPKSGEPAPTSHPDENTNDSSSTPGAPAATAGSAASGAATTGAAGASLAADSTKDGAAAGASALNKPGSAGKASSSEFTMAQLTRANPADLRDPFSQPDAIANILKSLPPTSRPSTPAPAPVAPTAPVNPVRVAPAPPVRAAAPTPQVMLSDRVMRPQAPVYWQSRPVLHSARRRTYSQPVQPVPTVQRPAATFGPAGGVPARGGNGSQWVAQAPAGQSFTSSPFAQPARVGPGVPPGTVLPAAPGQPQQGPGVPGQAPQPAAPAPRPEDVVKSRVDLRGILLGPLPSAFITVDNAQTLVHAGDVLLNGFKVIEIAEDSLTLSDGKTKVVIR